MKRVWSYRNILLLLLPLLFCIAARAQKTNDVLRIEDGTMIIKLDKRNSDECSHLIKFFDLNEDSLWKYQNIGKLAKEGWTLKHIDKNVAEIAKPVEGSNKIAWGK